MARQQPLLTERSQIHAKEESASLAVGQLASSLVRQLASSPVHEFVVQALACYGLPAR